MLVAGEGRGEKNNRGIQLPPDAITCAPEQHLFCPSTPDSKEYPPLSEDDNGPLQLGGPGRNGM